MSVTHEEVYSVVQGLRKGYIFIEDIIMLTELQDFTKADADSVIDKNSMVIMENIENNEEFE